ncbi:acyl-CoA dehydrogenase family protein [Streptomyces canus]|uniref:acyl-CoA dehydrogenase family protein n=1 Tax=Streptomyces canus TaxID=58343 RepID=UPI002E358511|nr:acyl-CoA dehydrogenase family protein [Streptomyces canus]
MTTDRILPSREAEDLLDLTRAIGDRHLATHVNRHERDETYPEGVFKVLADAGLLGLPYSEEFGGGGQPYEVYLQVLEELAARWAAVAVATSVHTLACFPLDRYGTAEQRERWLPQMLDGRLIGGYSLSEPHAGSDAAALTCQAVKFTNGYTISGTKSWITHGGRADFYALFARTGVGPQGISCFLAPGSHDRLAFGPPEQKMGLHAIPTTTAYWDGAELEAERLIGAEGQGLGIARRALPQRPSADT